MNRVSSGEFISLSDVEDEWAQKNAEAKKSKTDAKKEKQNKKAANEMGLSQSDYTKYQEALAKFQREAVENGIDPNVAKNYINAYTTQVKKGAITVGSLSKKFNKAITENMTGKSVATQLNLLKYHMDQLGVSEKQQTTIAEKLSKAYKDGKISYADYASLAKRSFSNTNELKTALSNLGIKMPKATSETKSFKEGLKNLSSTFDRLGTKPEKQSEYIEILEDAVDNGTLSMKDYRKIVDDTTISSDELSAAIKKVKPKSVKVSANVNGKKTLDEIDKEIKSMKDKTVKVDAQTKGEGKITSLSDAWNAITEKTKTLTATFNDNFTVPLKKAWNNVAKSINKFVAKIPFVGEKIVKVPTFPGYATGGFPSMGQLFIANEAGPELVGNMNGKTTVANQNEIAEGFASAITKTLAPVMYAAFKQAATETAQQNGGDVYLDGRKITESVVSHVNNISKSRGKSPIWGVT